MSRYEDGLRLIEERCGKGKDNVISLATITVEPGADGRPRPFVRDVDAYYEDGVFYVTTWATSKKMKQIEANPEVAFSVCFEWMHGNGVGENLGWVMKPENAELRDKLRKCFAKWYDHANKEDNEKCVILAIRITRCNVIKDHGKERYFMDFVNKAEGKEGQVV
jgi:general stress protein 26